MSAPALVVLDTNVVLSALVFTGGMAGRVRSLWQQGQFTPLVSQDTTRELMQVLAYPKFRLSSQEQEELLADYLPYARVVRWVGRPAGVPDCRDPDDVKFLELAIAGRARVLVTGDKDLLVLSGHVRFQILTPAQWLDTASFSA